MPLVYDLRHLNNFIALSLLKLFIAFLGPVLFVISLCLFKTNFRGGSRIRHGGGATHLLGGTDSCGPVLKNVCQNERIGPLV